MSLSISQKSRLFELIHELLEENSGMQSYDEWGPVSAEDYEKIAEQFDKKENELIAYVNTL
ncbi:hypothetical protein AVV67_gp113 [Escherichia phage vB_EcoM_VR25]|uniref:Uncharacterized protein n=1 Tax=Escherichia phage vB_EcoM_VR25 TaxID=1567028 RepID=A0A0A7HCJ5_9CAUD|nr:hypothetical protein AVV67_gp113 [Escherichia phage vB_EcoM_VR25]AIZ02457.1 hypothetical protein VR25_113 [Escherichia phage vB_EcoM_VR25]